MLSFLSLILFGLVVGVIAKLLMPGRDPGGFIITILLGIAGAVLGGYVGRLMGLLRAERRRGLLHGASRLDSSAGHLPDDDEAARCLSSKHSGRLSSRF